VQNGDHRGQFLAVQTGQLKDHGRLKEQNAHGRGENPLRVTLMVRGGMLMARKPRKRKLTGLHKKARTWLDSFNLSHRPSFRRWLTLGSDGTTIRGRIRTPMRDPALEAELTEGLKTGVKAETVDLQFTGPVVSLPLLDRRVTTEGKPVKTLEERKTLRIGSSISLVDARSGTLGFFAKDKKTGRPGIVSANHVIGGQDRAQLNDPILSPGGLEYGPRVASFVRFVPLSGGGEKYVDCAFALLETDDYDPKTLPNRMELKAQPAPVATGQTVFKYSEAGNRQGKVTQADQDEFKLHYRSEIGLVFFDNQIEVESSDGEPFSDPGDSGSLVADDQGRPVGLLFAHTLAGGSNSKGLSYVNPIASILEQLDVELLTEWQPLS
jgi:hypothetical protein